MRYTLIIVAFLLVACATPTPVPITVTRPLPTATLTVAASPPTPGRTVEPGFTLIPTTPLPPTSTPVPCTSDAKFVRDITVPDFSPINGGAIMDKRWAVRNSGTCDWGREYRVMFVEGSSMGAANEQALYPAKAGSEAIIQISMTAPIAPGDYNGKWQLRDPKGKSFGEVLFIKIKVLAATATP